MAMKCLSELKKNLEAETTPKTFFGEDHYSIYDTGLKNFCEICGDETPVAVENVLLVISKLFSTERRNRMRICSLGCGDGVTDRSIIVKVLETYPGILIEYVGVEIDSARSTRAEDLLSSLSEVAVTVYNQDLLQDIPEAKFDLVWALHSLYYIKSCAEGINQAVKLTKDAGAVLVSMTREGPLHEPLSTIHKHVNSNDAIMSSKIPDSFESLNIPYTVLDEFYTTVDLTKAIQNNFNSYEDKCLLSFLLYSLTEYHSPATIQSCCDYFKAVAQREGGKYLVPLYVDYFSSYGPFT